MTKLSPFMMQAENLEVSRSSAQPSSRDDSSWPVERIPSGIDAELAHRPVDVGLVQSFKHAILSNAARDTEYLNDATEAFIRDSRPQNLNAYYPLTLAAVLPAVPPDISPTLLLDAFRDTGYPNMPLIHHIPPECFNKPNLPEYLVCAMATMGSLILAETSSVTHSWWSTANTLITSNLEVDNREARKADLINAWVLLAMYGTLCADSNSWQKMNTTHGYVATAARRLYMNASSGSHCAALPAFLLSDVLRAIHYGDPLIISIFECLAQPTEVNISSLSIYRAIVLEGRSPTSEDAKDGSLLALIAILADIHTLAHVFQPLVMDSGPKMPGTQPENSIELTNFHNSYLPFSPDNETRKARGKLLRALDFWATAYLPTSPRRVVVPYNFCKMYLALPTLQMLPSLAKYPPRFHCEVVPSGVRQTIVDSELQQRPGAHKFAWEILENVIQEPGITPPWLPIAVFYASLVIWRSILLQLDSGGNGSLKVLLLFKEEL